MTGAQPALRSGRHRRHAGQRPHGTEPINSSDAVAVVAALGSATAEPIAPAHLRQIPQAVYLNAAHELRAPLARLLDELESLRRPDYGTLSQAQLEIAERIGRTCQRMQRLVEDCFSYGRMISEDVPFVAQPADINALLDELMAAWTPAFRKKGVQLLAHSPGSMAAFPCDPHKLLRIASVLIENALKFTPAGGRVELQWRRCPWDLGGSQDQEALYVAVRDTGCGIAPEYQQEVFKPFVRLNMKAAPLEHGALPGTASYRRRKDDSAPGVGLGLGLAVAARLVQLHGGRIWVESEPNSGSTFAVLLPPAQLAAAVSA